MSFKLPGFGISSLATKAASNLAPKVKTAAEYVDDPRLAALDAVRFGGKILTKATVDNPNVPIAIRGFANDVFLDKDERKQEFTEDDLSQAEKAAYVFAARDAYGTGSRQSLYNSPGRSNDFTLDYDNYQAPDDRAVSKSSGSTSEKYNKAADLLLDPNYNARYFTGTASGTLNPDQSFTIKDTYDHNDRIPEESFKSPRDKDRKFLNDFLSDKVPFSNIRDKMKQVSQYYGADPRTGEGAKVNINVNQDRRGDARSNNPGYEPMPVQNPYLEKLRSLGDFFGFDE